MPNPVLGLVAAAAAMAGIIGRPYEQFAEAVRGANEAVRGFNSLRALEGLTPLYRPKRRTARGRKQRKLLRMRGRQWYNRHPEFRLSALDWSNGPILPGTVEAARQRIVGEIIRG